eukprot:8932426-Pyramimonas_sp.AAC.1
MHRHPPPQSSPPSLPPPTHARGNERPPLERHGPLGTPGRGSDPWEQGATRALGAVGSTAGRGLLKLWLL